MSVSTLELNQLRIDTEDYLADTCTIQTPTRTADGMGGWSTSWANTYTSVACHIWQKTGSEQPVGDQPTAVTRWIINVHWDQALDNTMRVIHGSFTYEVNDLNNDGTDLLHRRAWITRMI